MFLYIMFMMGAVELTAQHVVMTAQGMVNGISMDGYTSYVGIPYASVTSASGRFKRAGAAPSWQGIRESRDPRCSSSSEVNDCLQLDVNVPTSGTSLPVFVWIKSGVGKYNPGPLAKKEIIVVIVRHRLGPLGFLCSQKYNIPGNSGLKDVVQALRWIRDNIIAFNGNSHKVVVGGQGFGAAMVEALILSPSARGLFHGAILQSGSILAPWAFNFDAEERATYLSMKLNNNDFTKISTVDLASKGEEIEMSYLPFALCIERAYKNEESVLLESPYRSMTNRQTPVIPLIIGYNNNEGYIFSTILKASKALRKTKNNLSFLLPIELQFSKKELPAITNEIRNTYFKNNVTMEAILNYHRDAYFLAHIHKSVRFHASQGSVYYYQFSYSGNVGVETEIDVTKQGAAHSDELAYLFPGVENNNLVDDDVIVHHNLIELWTNFVKYLNPNSMKADRPTWEAVNPNHIRVLDITTNMEMIDFPQAKEVRVWEDLYEKYYQRRSDIA